MADKRTKRQPHPAGSFFISLCLFVPLCLSALLAIAQLCKTNPISKTHKPTQPLMPQRLTAISNSPLPRKNKPNQTQFLKHRMAYDITHPTYEAKSNLPLAIRDTKTNPILPPLHAPRFTLHEMRHPTYACPEGTCPEEETRTLTNRLISFTEWTESVTYFRQRLFQESDYETQNPNSDKPCSICHNRINSHCRRSSLGRFGPR